ncbi:MAG: hypothetical protein LKJ86_08055 [Oscillibacter sp.]|nr:hypothetical protein [Oscillibacter sp.]
MARNSTPRILLKSVRYPTYQLYAIASNAAESAENQLIIGALSVLEWLRTKFREFEIPESFQSPSPEQYADVSISDLKSEHIDCGYTVETVCIPDEKVWSFRLIEPDLSTRWEAGEEISTAIPGRVFETNIAFHVVGKSMYMGVNIIVSEPENTDEKNQAIVLRPAVVPVLTSNPKLGLSAGYLLENRLWELNSKERHKQLRENLKKWMIPAVVFCDYIPEAKVEKDYTPKFEVVPGGSPIDLAQMFKQPRTSLNLSQQLQASGSGLRNDAPIAKPQMPYDTEVFTRARHAYVHSFHLPSEQFDAFSKILHIEVHNGDVIFLEPYELGAGVLRYEYSESNKDENFSALMALSRDYLREKAVKFENIVFLSGAKIMLSEQYKQANLSTDDTIKVYEERIQALCNEHKNELMERNDKIQQQANKITRLKNQLDDVVSQIEDIKKQAAEEVSEAHNSVNAMVERMEYLESLSRRPKTPQEIPEWVQERFAGRLEFHQRAVKLIQGVSASEIDMQLLCDAIEYLAMEYRDLKTGNINWEDASKKCAEKYDRPFEVTGCGATSIEMYSSQYKIKYKTGYKGKPVETPLNEHLKVGKTAGNLIRIYFLYDDERKMIIVGSLPYHLKVAQIQA